MPSLLRWSLIVATLLLALAMWAGEQAAPPNVSKASDPVSAPANGPSSPANIDAAPSPRTAAAPAIPGDGVVVHAIDGSGRGVADIPVEIVCSLPAMAGEQSVAAARTDAAGYAVLVADAARLQRLREAGIDATFRVVAAILSPTPPHALLGAQPVAAGIVTLQLPDSGTVIVHVQDAQGQAIDDGGDVFLFWRQPGGSAWDRIGTPRAPSRGGTAQLMVPLGKQLLLRASGTEALQSGEVVVMGPVGAGEVVTTELRLGLPWARVVGRLVDEAGARIASDRLQVGIGVVAADAPADLPKQSSGGWVQLDAQGRFSVRAPVQAPPGKRFCLVAEDRDTRRETVRKATVALPAVLASGVDFDVGDVVLAGAAERLLCSGRVVDGAGAPIALAEVAAGYWDRDAGRWVALHRQRVRSAEDGSFAIHSAVPAPERFSLSAAANGRVRAELQIGGGSEGLQLVLPRGGSLQARITAPAGVPAMKLVGAVIDAEGRRREPDQFGGSLRVDGLAPGLYDVVVRIADSPWELLTVRGIAVAEGQRSDDPRLASIDVGDRCRALHLLLRDASGAPRMQLRARIVDGQDRGVSMQTDRDGRALVVVPRAATGFALVTADGRRIAVAAQDEEQTLVLP